MQTNNTRLFKAAKRTLRAEVTLVIFIVLVTSWSIYALYKLTLGNSESILGLNINKLLQNQEKSSRDTSNSSISASLVTKAPIYLPTDEIKKRTQLIRKLITERQRQLLSKDLALPERDVQTIRSYPMSGFYSINQRNDSDLKLVRDLRVARGLNDIMKKQFNEIHLERPTVDNSPVDSAVEEVEASDYPPSKTNKDDYEATRDEDDNSNDRSAQPSELPVESPRDQQEASTEADISDESNSRRDGSVNEETSEDQNDNLPNPNDTTQEDIHSESKDSDDANVESEPNETSQSDTSQEDENNAKDSSNSIDEDVDRMTQPSLGVASRQDQPVDYKNVVQFDDALTGSSHKPIKSNKSAKKTQSSTGLIGQFIDRSVDRNNKRTNNKRGYSDDLLVDQNHLAPSSKLGEKSPKFLNRLIEMPKPMNNSHTAPTRTRFQRSPADDNRTKEASNPIDRYQYEYSSPEPHESTTNETLTVLPVAHQASRKPVKSNEVLVDKTGEFRHLRTKLDRYNADEDYHEDLRSPDEGQTIDKRSDDSITSPVNYHYVTSDDAALRELLAQKQLLDALNQSQPPAPVLIPPKSSVQRDNSSANVAPASQQQTSESLYSIDHGLLLYPSNDVEHHHKSKKKKKAEKSKAKKKMTIAMKKGGHKKKKHKKEEKKYLKEKKFKGAKKGKKVHKGKGGQGGKKGKKFYKDKGFKKKGFKNVYHKEEFGQKKSYFDEFRDKDFKKKWKKYDDKYNYAKMKKWQAKDVKGAKKMKDQGEKFKKYDKGKWKKQYSKHHHEAKKKKSSDEYD